MDYDLRNLVKVEDDLVLEQINVKAWLQRLDSVFFFRYLALNGAELLSYLSYNLGFQEVSTISWGF